MGRRQLKLEGITVLGQDHYEIRCRAVNRQTGQMEEARRRVRGTLTEAVHARDEVKDELRRGEKVDRVRPRVADYASWWLDLKKPELKGSTEAKYRTVIEQYIKPKLGQYFLDALTPVHVAEWVRDLSKTYKGTTVLNALRVLRTMTRDAMAHHHSIMTLWPCERVKPPRIVEPSDPKTINLITAKELDTLLMTVQQQEPYWYAVTQVMAFTGLRWAEVTALRWDDIDTDNEVIHVRRGNWRGNIDTTKTSINLDVPLLVEVRQVLNEHFDWFEAHKTLRRGRPEQWATPRKMYEGFLAGWIFPSKRGGLHKGWPMSKVLKRAMGKAQIDKRLTGHGLRRTFNDLLRRVAEGQVVRAITGHNTVAMTEHYSHIDAGEKQAASRRMFQSVKGGAK